MVGAHPEQSPKEGRSSPESRAESRGAGTSGLRSGVGGGGSRWRAALAVTGLSILLPGTGHLYVRHVRRAVAWSLVFLLGVLPAAVFAFLVASSFTWKSVYWIACVVVVFGLVCALGPLVTVLRRQRGVAGGPRLPPNKWTLGAYVVAGMTLAVLEAVVFLGPCLRSARVESSALEPLVSRGDTVTLLVSRYVHPVHGDVVLFRVGLGSQDLAASDPSAKSPSTVTKLGRVLADSEDRVEASEGQLRINGIPLDLSRTDQDWLLAKAGRKERRLRALRSLLKPVSMLIPGLGEEVVQNVVRWDVQELEAGYVPEDRLLILPDWEQESLAPASEPTAASGAHRPRWAILVPRTAIEGRMIF